MGGDQKLGKVNDMNSTNSQGSMKPIKHLISERFRGVEASDETE
jgi:hypothetical protein